MENNMVPKLRFPEFEGEWTKKKVGEIFYVNAGGDIDKKHVSQEKTETFQYPIYANASENKGFYAYSDIYKIEPPVITVAGRGVYIGIAHARNHRFYPIVRLLVLKPKREQNIYFFEYRLNKINLFIESTGVPQLTAPQISNYKIKYPKIEEQTKIATFLTDIDKRINILQKKKAELEKYKKGMMQKLFSQTIRFIDENGNNFPAWEEKELGKICEITKGKQLNKSELAETGTYPTINGGIEPSGYTEEWNTKENTITISEGGNSCGYVNFIRTKFWSGGHCYSLLNLNKQIDKIFLYQFLKFYQNQIMRLRVGSGLPNIQKGDISNFKIKLPKQLEQQKIANFLLSIDNSIEKLDNQIDNSLNFTRGLLQKMFV